MKKIGFIDYFIDEWHANKYVGLVDEISKEYGYDFKVCYGYGEIDDFPGKITTSAWCEKYGVTKCDSIKELCKKSDYIMILAPANPEMHLRYAKEVLKYKKTTYIDKTFAPNIVEAKKIFALGEKYQTPFFSTSALRYADEIDEFNQNVKAMQTLGGGRAFDEYIIHQIEMIVKCMGTNAQKVMVTSNGRQTIGQILFENGNIGYVTYSYNYGFKVDIMKNDGSVCTRDIASNTFKNLIKSVLKFFLDGTMPFESNQTLEVIAIRDTLIKALKTPNTWVKIKR